VVGKEVEFDDGAVDDNGNAEPPVKVWVQKLNPIDHSNAMKQANAARARILAMRKGSDDPEYMSLVSDVDDIPEREDLIQYAIAEQLYKAEMSAESELAESDEWSKDGYLEGLRDAWIGGLESKMVEFPDDPEVIKVRSELEKFRSSIDERMVEVKEDLMVQHEIYTDDELRQKVLTRMIDIQADMEWMKELRRCQVFYSCREPENHKVRYFSNLDEVDELPNEVFGVLLQAYEELEVPVSEGKD
jgi:hypothetical protein